VALAHRLWDGLGLLDFTKTYSRGEYGHKYYSGRRMWDGLRRFKPSLVLPAEYGDLKNDKPAHAWGMSTYPFSVVPDVKLTPAAIFAAHRSHYEGTEYDTTRGMAAGAFGTPDRYPTIGAPGDPGEGSWERTVSIYRTTYTWVAQAKAGLPSDAAGLIWWGVGDSSKTVFNPLMVSAGEPPQAVTLGRQSHLDRRSFYWAVRYLSNLAQIRYDRMIVDIQAHSKQLEAAAFTLQTKLRSTTDPTRRKQLIDTHATEALTATWQLCDDLMVRYADGVQTTPQPDGTVVTSNIGYSAKWLASKEVNFTAGPHRLPPPA